jgi:hypothetical protein
MLAGAVNLQIEQLELQWSLLLRCVTKSEPKSGKTNRIRGKRDTTRRPSGGTKSYPLYSIATCPLRLPPVLFYCHLFLDLVKRQELEWALRSSKVVTLPELRMRLRQKESLAAPQGFEPR